MPWLEQLQSANWGQGSCIALGAYVLGCFTTGYYLVRWRTGQDIRTLGSGTAGARNVGRVLGMAAFLITVLGDCGKGAFVVWATRHFTNDDRLAMVAMLAVVSGHVWPAQLGFRGGKGVATSLGALSVYDVHLASAFLMLFGIGALVMRRTVLPGLFAFAGLPFVSKYLGDDRPKVVGISVLAGLVLLAHRKNMSEEFWHFMERRHIHPEHDHSEL